MPNGHSHKKYGGHKYADHDGTSSCEFGCGCWMGPSRSGSPTGLDPFGACPKNPIDGNLLGGNADYDRVVTQRIEDLSLRLQDAEARLRQVEPSKEELASELSSIKAQLAEKESKLARILRSIHDET